MLAPSSASFPGTWAGSWVRSRTARSGTSTPVRNASTAAEPQCWPPLKVLEAPWMTLSPSRAVELAWRSSTDFSQLNQIIVFPDVLQSLPLFLGEDRCGGAWASLLYSASAWLGVLKLTSKASPPQCLLSHFPLPWRRASLPPSYLS